MTPQSGAQSCCCGPGADNKMVKKQKLRDMAGNQSPRLGRSSSSRGLWSTPAPQRTKRQRVFQVNLPDAKGSLHLTPINESPSSPQEFIVQTDKPRGLASVSVQKESTYSSCASGSVNSDSTSEMILPSGVSTFFLACMDSDLPDMPSLSDSSESSLSSPEVFRKSDCLEEAFDFLDEDEYTCEEIRNSTLLDTSHAVDINMKQPLNLSDILELSEENNEDIQTRNAMPGTTKASSVTCATSVSGKIVTNFYVTQEITRESRITVEVPIPFKQPKKRQAFRPVKCRKKVTFKESVIMEKTFQSPGMSCDTKVTTKQVIEKVMSVCEPEKIAASEGQKKDSWQTVPEKANDGEERREAEKREKGRSTSRHFPSSLKAAEYVRPSSKSEPHSVNLPERQSKYFSKRHSPSPREINGVSVNEEEYMTRVPWTVHRIKPFLMKVPFREEEVEINWLTVTTDPSKFLERMGIKESEVTRDETGTHLPYRYFPPGPDTKGFIHKCERIDLNGMKFKD
ncbi:uncharacterized protein LOC136762786 [Amia ocellicauda]|uniref:uncharacterized protein LOC136762786 n=1 Tax=Amia ocellicauda TaxID=2972642 RepID=UPI0034643B7A